MLRSYVRSNYNNLIMFFLCYGNLLQTRNYFQFYKRGRATDDSELNYIIILLGIIEMQTL